MTIIMNAYLDEIEVVMLKLNITGDNPYLQLIHKARALMLQPLEYYDKHNQDDTEIKRNKTRYYF